MLLSVFQHLVHTGALSSIHQASTCKFRHICKICCGPSLWSLPDSEASKHLHLPSFFQSILCCSVKIFSPPFTWYPGIHPIYWLSFYIKPPQHMLEAAKNNNGDLCPSSLIVIEHINHQGSILLGMSIDASTARTYSSTHNSYLTFCKWHGLLHQTSCRHKLNVSLKHTENYHI